MINEYIIINAEKLTSGFAVTFMLFWILQRTHSDSDADDQTKWCAIPRTLHEVETLI